MEFVVKNYKDGVYKELIIHAKNAVTLESGLLDEGERRQLADDLQGVIDDLLHGLEPLGD